MKILSILILFLGGQQVWGKKFSNSFLEFELPPTWNCELDMADWICQGQNKNRQKEAIIIISAKERDREDSLEEYEKHLKKGRSYRPGKEKSYLSQPKYLQKRRIQNHLWIDSLHLASEVPGFYTRYLVTVKGQRGVAVTFSVSARQYQSYKALFDKIMGSLKFFQQKSMGLSLLKLRGKQDLPALNHILPLTSQREKQNSPISSSWPFFLSCLILAIVWSIRHRKKIQQKKAHGMPSPKERDKLSA